MSSPEPTLVLPAHSSLDVQSVEYYEGEGPIHRSAKSPNRLVTSYDRNVKTLYQALSASFDKQGDAPCLGRRVLKDGKWSDYQWVSYKQTKQTFLNFGAGLVCLGLSQGKHVGIYSANRPEWAISYLGALSQGIVIIPLYDTLAPDAITYVINHSELDTVCCSLQNLPKLLTVAPDCPTLKKIVVFDLFGDPEIAKAKAIGITLLHISDVEKKGSEAPAHPIPQVTPDDLVVIMYTSGTTGVPKGVMLTNGNFVAALASVQYSGLDLGPKDVHLSYLPLAHIFEILCLTACLNLGGQIGFWRGDLTGLMEDIQTLRPTLLVGVPRVFNRIYDKIQATIQKSTSTRTLFNYAYNAKLAQLQNTGDETSPIWDRLVFSKLAAMMGGRLRMITSGSAPLSPNVQNFLRICFLCDVIQGYGLTETTGVLTLADNADRRAGHVGSPSVTAEVKLVDVPEMNYTSSSRGKQQGEVCVRGATVFKGYYKMPEKTAEDIDRNGWFHTGDIGEWLPNGTLKIIDRKKNIFKLAQGEYVAAEFLETVYLRSTFAMQVFVYGDSFKNYLVAIVVPDPEILLPWAKERGIKGDLPAICSNPTVRLTIYQSLIKVAEKAKLKGFEKVKNIYLEPVPWSIENGLLTPTMKTKRPELKKKYDSVIISLYNEPRLDGHVSRPKL